MAGSAPNFSVTGFQASLVRKPQPNFWKAGTAPADQRHDDAAQQHQHAPSEELRGAAEGGVLQALAVEPPARRDRQRACQIGLPLASLMLAVHDASMIFTTFSGIGT